jgi:CubicO group peptidase (beta-lactamase class C family)
MRIPHAAFLIALLGMGRAATAQSPYFPPVIGNTWETTDPGTLGWCPDRIDSLYAYLDSHNTKGFIVLKDGRIVLEHYAGTFTQDSLWYWASAGKTLTSLLTGIAQEEGYLDIDLPVDTYLGPGWSAEPPDKEALITVRNQLTMTSGLDDGVTDNHCTLDTCLQYLADAGMRWAYHNAPYTLLDPVITAATDQNFSLYFDQRIRNPIGMGGFWFYSGYDHVYASTVRGMARYGLLALGGFVWDGDTLLHDQDYAYAMTHPSQALNNAYGYLWWLNGQPDFMLPGLQIVFPGPILPNAPADMFNALGKNDQMINVVPSEGLVLVRMGEAADEAHEVSLVFDDIIWQYMNALSCNAALTEAETGTAPTRVYPNPCTDEARILLPPGSGNATIILGDAMGRTVLSSTDPHLDVASLPPGLYTVRVVCRAATHIARLLKQ